MTSFQAPQKKSGSRFHNQKLLCMVICGSMTNWLVTGSPCWSWTHSPSLAGSLFPFWLLHHRLAVVSIYIHIYLHTNQGSLHWIHAQQLENVKSELRFYLWFYLDYKPTGMYAKTSTDISILSSYSSLCVASAFSPIQAYLFTRKACYFSTLVGSSVVHLLLLFSLKVVQALRPCSHVLLH